MSIRNMSGGFLGTLIVVIVLGFIAGCSDDQATSIDTTAPGAPVGLRAASNYSDIYLRWSANSESDLAGYNVYSAVDGGTVELVAVLPPTSTRYQQTCERDHQYSYEITAVDEGANESASSAQVRIMHNSQGGGRHSLLDNSDPQDPSDP